MMTFTNKRSSILLRHGDPLLLRMQTRIVADQFMPRNLSVMSDWLYLALFLPYSLFQSFLGVFGWMILYLPTWFYSIFGIFWLAAMSGAAIALARRRWDIVRSALIFTPIILFLIIFDENLTYISSQSRYFFPALISITLLFVFGLAELPTPWRRISLADAPLYLLSANLFPFWLVWNSFAH